MTCPICREYVGLGDGSVRLYVRHPNQKGAMRWYLIAKSKHALELYHQYLHTHGEENVMLRVRPMSADDLVVYPAA